MMIFFVGCQVIFDICAILFGWFVVACYDKCVNDLHAANGQLADRVTALEYKEKRRATDDLKNGYTVEMESFSKDALDDFVRSLQEDEE